MNCGLQHKSLQKIQKSLLRFFRPEPFSPARTWGQKKTKWGDGWSWPPRRCSPAPVAAPAASAHSSDSKLTLDTARRFVSLDVPELDAEVVNSFVEVGADGATRFRCPCFVVRDSCGGRGSNKSSSVTLTRRRNLNDHVKTASHRACEYNCESGSCCSSGLGSTAEGACQWDISVDFFSLFSFAPFVFPLATWSQGLPVHKHKSAFDTAM